MKKILSLVLMFILVIGTMVPGYAASQPLVEKVVFKDLISSLDHLGLGGVRFYDESVLIESGNELVVGSVAGETDQFIVNATSSLGSTSQYYDVPHVVDSNRSQTGDYNNKSYWLATNSDSNPELTVEFKTATQISQIEYVPHPDSRDDDRGVTEPFVLELHTSDGKIYSDTITPISENNTVQTIDLSSILSPQVTLDIEAASYELTAGDTIDVNVVIQNASDILAEDISVQYDSSAFELLNSEVVDMSSDTIFYKNEISGSARYIVSSNGAINAINTDKSILVLTFKVKNYDGTSEISVLSGLVADSIGTEYIAECGGKTFTLTGVALDVNGDEVFTLGDLAIASNLLGTESNSWGAYTPDFDMNGLVETLDLSEIVAMIIQ